jgi:hypothetical protein
MRGRFTTGLLALARRRREARRSTAGRARSPPHGGRWRRGDRGPDDPRTASTPPWNGRPHRGARAARWGRPARVGQVAPAMDEHEPQVVEPVERAREDELRGADAGLQWVADEVRQVVVLQARLGPGVDGVEEQDGTELLRPLEDRRELGTSHEPPRTIGATIVPRSPSSRWIRASSSWAASGSWSGNVPRDAKPVPHVAASSAMPSFTRRAAVTASAAGFS